ncbi:MAG: methylmalonyl-CoA epimerase [Vicingaceae bacterium]|nr:MAG: methylmalonyl-CoA epimerase [Vicingaceae bacterium]
MCGLFCCIKYKPMINKIEHIGIAVKDLEKAIETFNRLLGKKPYKEEVVESEGVKTVFYQVGEVKIELLAAIRSDVPLAKFLETKGEGIHHIAFATDNLDEERNRLKDFRWIYAQNRDGADNKVINFLHPSDTQKVLVEFCQEKETR